VTPYPGGLQENSPLAGVVWAAERALLRRAEIWFWTEAGRGAVPRNRYSFARGGAASGGRLRPSVAARDTREGAWRIEARIAVKPVSARAGTLLPRRGSGVELGPMKLEEQRPAIYL
jgi:hypothetical protein